MGDSTNGRHGGNERAPISGTQHKEEYTKESLSDSLVYSEDSTLVWLKGTVMVSLICEPG